MYEVVFTREPRDQRNPLHHTLGQCVEYAEANEDPGYGFEIWQVADDIDRTRVCCVLTATLGAVTQPVSTGSNEEHVEHLSGLKLQLQEEDDVADLPYIAALDAAIAALA